VVVVCLRIVPAIRFFYCHIPQIIKAENPAMRIPLNFTIADGKDQSNFGYTARHYFTILNSKDWRTFPPIARPFYGYRKTSPQFRRRLFRLQVAASFRFFVPVKEKSLVRCD